MMLQNTDHKICDYTTAKILIIFAEMNNKIISDSASYICKYYGRFAIITYQSTRPKRLQLPELPTTGPLLVHTFLPAGPSMQHISYSTECSQCSSS